MSPPWAPSLDRDYPTHNNPSFSRQLTGSNARLPRLPEFEMYPVWGASSKRRQRLPTLCNQGRPAQSQRKPNIGLLTWTEQNAHPFPPAVSVRGCRLGVCCQAHAQDRLSRAPGARPGRDAAAHARQARGNGEVPAGEMDRNNVQTSLMVAVEPSARCGLLRFWVSVERGIEGGAPE